MYLFLYEMERRIAGWMERYEHLLARYSLGIVFIWFGGLKPFGLSPAQELVSHTVFWFPPEIFVPILGWWEVAIGVGLLFRPLLRITLFLLFLQMPDTALPPGAAVRNLLYRLPLRATPPVYHQKLHSISAALVIGGTVSHHPSKECFL